MSNLNNQSNLNNLSNLNSLSNINSLNNLNNRSNFNSQSNLNTNSNNTDSKIKTLEDKLNKLEKKVVQITTKNHNSNIIHMVACSNCKQNQIIGTRYLCGNCNQANLQYNLCSKCIMYRESLHPNNHFFIMIHDSKLWG